MTAPSLVWQELLSCALLGTDRQAARVQLDGPVGELTSQLATQSRESAFLGTAAAVRLYYRAGQRPVRSSAQAPSASPAETTEAIGNAAVEHLRKMLRGEFASLLPEWLALVKSAGLRVPERVLVELLERGTRDIELREHISPVLGQRGVWLASLNPSWSWATPPGNTGAMTVWETGAKPARKLFIQQLRRAEPAQARELIAAAFPEEAAEERTALVEVLRHGLSMADEPFLETCLDDRAESVRTRARELLGQLPESRFCARMYERVRGGLTLRKTPDSLKLELVPPMTADESMVRDGLEPRNPKETEKKATPSRRMRWVAKMVAFVPPSHWVALLGKSPAEILVLLRNHEWETLILGSLNRATLVHRDTEWVEALIAEDRADDELFRLLAPVRMEAVCRARVEQDQPLQETMSEDLLASLPRPWGLDFSRAFLSAFIRQTRQQSRYQWRVEGLIRLSAQAMPTELADEVDRLASEIPDNNEISVESCREQLRELAKTLRFRAELAAALTG